MPDRSERRRYVRAVLDLYRATPQTRGKTGRGDRALAGKLYDDGTPIGTVRHALILATARRHLRPKKLPPLDRVASLHYFRPVIDEILESPPPADYLDYVTWRIRNVAPALTGPLPDLHRIA